METRKIKLNPKKIKTRGRFKKEEERKQERKCVTEHIKKSM